MWADYSSIKRAYYFQFACLRLGSFFWIISLALGDRTRSFPEVKLGKRSLFIKAANQRLDPHRASNLHALSTYDLHDGEESRRPEPAVHMLAGLADLLMIRYKVRCTLHPALRPLFALHTHLYFICMRAHTHTSLYLSLMPFPFWDLAPPSSGVSGHPSNARCPDPGTRISR